MRDWLREVRFAGRLLGKSPGPAIVAVVALGLGIGLATTSFSIAWGVLFRGLPFPGGDRIMDISTRDAAHPESRGPVDLHDFVDWRARQTSFESLVGYDDGTVNLSGAERAERFDGAYVTANAFDALGVRPFLGRTFRPGDDAPGTPLVVILSHWLWTTRYDGDPAVVGRAIRINGMPATVVGVMPPRFAFPFREKIWVSLKLDLAAAPRGKARAIAVIGRLKEEIGRAHV